MQITDWVRKVPYMFAGAVMMLLFGVAFGFEVWILHTELRGSCERKDVVTESNAGKWYITLGRLSDLSVPPAFVALFKSKSGHRYVSYFHCGIGGWVSQSRLPSPSQAQRSTARRPDRQTYTVRIAHKPNIRYTVTDTHEATCMTPPPPPAPTLIAIKLDIPWRRGMCACAVPRGSSMRSGSLLLSRTIFSRRCESLLGVKMGPESSFADLLKELQ